MLVQKLMTLNQLNIFKKLKKLPYKVMEKFNFYHDRFFYKMQSITFGKKIDNIIYIKRKCYIY